MPSPLQKRKLIARFYRLDTNKNGEIGQDDYELLIQRLTASAQESSPAAEQVRQTYRRMWRGLQKSADSDSNQKVTLDEFVNAEAAVVDNPERYNEILPPLADAIIEMLDTNGDKQLTAEEFQALFRGYGLSEQEAAETYARLDRDGNGFLTRDELQQALREFYLSDDPEAPGNWLFGPF